MISYRKLAKCHLKIIEYKLIKALCPFISKEKCDKKIEKYEYRLNSLKFLTPGEECTKKVQKENAGKYVYLCEHTIVASPDTQIGSFVSVAANVSIGTTHHPTNFLSTHPFCYFNQMKLKETIHQVDFNYNTPCKIGNDVWIGKQAIIMDGVTVNDGAIVGANAVVTHDVPPYAIVAGVPAKILRYRFEENIIKDLLELKWWELDDKYIANLPFDDVPECIRRLKEIRNNL